MKTIVLSLIFVASLCGCSAQSSNLSQDIIGCWESVNVQHIVESNSSEFDQYAVEKRNRQMKKDTNPHFSKFTAGTEYLFDKNTEKVLASRSYYIEGDSLYTKMVDAGGYRTIYDSSKIRIENDTLFAEIGIISEIESVYAQIKIFKTFDLPKDFEIEKAVRIVKMVRLKDCSQYKENQ